MTQGGTPAHDLGLKIRNIATSKCFTREMHQTTPLRKNAQPTGMNLYEVLNKA